MQSDDTGPAGGATEPEPPSALTRISQELGEIAREMVPLANALDRACARRDEDSVREAGEELARAARRYSAAFTRYLTTGDDGRLMHLRSST